MWGLSWATVQKFIWCKAKCFSALLTSHLNLWHNVGNKAASLPFVHKMFCNVSYFHFARHKEKFMWGSYFTFIFPFPRAGFGLSDKTDGPSYILLVGKGEHYFQRWTLQNDQSDSCFEKHQALFIFSFKKCHSSRRNYSCLYMGDGWWIYTIITLVDLLSEQQLKKST